MRSFSILLSLLYLWSSTSLVNGLGYGAGLPDPDAAPTIPACAVDCLGEYVPKFCNSSTDLTCTCTNLDLAAAIEKCAYQTCNTTEVLETERYQAINCGFKNDRSRLDMVLKLDYSAPFITVIVMCGRLMARVVLGVGLGYDDWTMIATFVVYAVTVGTSLGMVLNGFGQHMYWLREPQIKASLKYFYITELFYIVCNTLSKLSLLLFFLRIFPIPDFRRRVLIFSVFVVLSNLAILLALTFQCTPISGYWTNWLYAQGSPKRTKCVDQYIALFTASAFSIFENLVILGLPMKMLWGLGLSLGRKINVLIMFSVGSGVVIFSFLRLPSLGKLSSSTSDLSYDQAPIVVYSHLELSFGIICACLPACRTLLEHYFPSLRVQHSDIPTPTNKSRDLTNTRFTSSTVGNRAHRNTSSRGLVKQTSADITDAKEMNVLEVLREIEPPRDGSPDPSPSSFQFPIQGPTINDSDSARDKEYDQNQRSSLRRSYESSGDIGIADGGEEKGEWSQEGAESIGDEFPEDEWELRGLKRSRSDSAKEKKSNGMGVIVMTKTVEQSSEPVENVRDEIPGREFPLGNWDSRARVKSPRFPTCM